MFGRMSPRSRMFRYLSPKPTLPARELDYLTNLDHVRHSAIAAFAGGPDGPMVGVARFAAYPSLRGTADVAAEIADEWQGSGLGTLLGSRVVERAWAYRYTVLRATTTWENAASVALLRRLGFRICDTAAGTLEFELALKM